MTHAHDQTVFGADGGGTKTNGVLIDSANTILAECQAGATNPNVVGAEQSARTLVELLLASCRTGGVAVEAVGAAVFGLAGVGTPAIRDTVLEKLLEEFAARRIEPPQIDLQTDARIALEGAFGGQRGIIVIAGTGSIVLGKTSEGEVDRVGGWGRILGDEGSGYRLGLEAIKAVTRDIDGRGERTALRGALRKSHGWARREDIVAAVYQDQFPIPSLAPLVLEAAESGDGVAQRILELEASALAVQIRALARRLGGTPPHGLVFIGGLIEHRTVYAETLRKILEREVPEVVVSTPAHSPVFGAALMARRLREVKG